jgi:hypothetical protein
MRNNPSSGFTPDSALLRTVAVHRALLGDEDAGEAEEEEEKKVRIQYVYDLCVN